MLFVQICGEQECDSTNVNIFNSSRDLFDFLFRV